VTLTRRAWLASGVLAAQQRADTEFEPAVEDPRYAEGTGPSVGIDEAHNNFHTVDGRYATFAKILRKDGFVVRKAGRSQDVLVIANALHNSNARNWNGDNPPAFTDSEVAGIEQWVAGGGGLLLIVDHQPFPGAASTLAKAFGAEFFNCYAVDPDRGRGAATFRKQDGSLRAHVVTEGVEHVMTFTGSAFKIAKGDPVLVFGPRAVGFVTDKPGREGRKRLEERSIAGWMHGAAIPHGKGRVYISGEAAMFSAQRTGAGAAPMGLNHPEARYNQRFLRRIAAWLAKAT